jgi:hypothetical protein
MTVTTLDPATALVAVDRRKGHHRLSDGARDGPRVRMTMPSTSRGTIR